MMELGSGPKCAPNCYTVLFGLTNNGTDDVNLASYDTTGDDV